MSAYSGKQGKATFAGGAVDNVLSWGIDATCSVAGSTPMDPTAYAAATHWKDYAAGFKDWTCSVTCDLDDSGLDPDLAVDFIDDDGLAVVLYGGMVSTDQQEGATVRKYSGSCIITGISVTTDKDDLIKVTYTAQGTSTLSVAATDLT